ncbi:lipoma-preferred partner homolog [Ylistrum balloti]|uniref:lipoma-preferred partner homolog n=1 Tax=Ylistrum balloti TaxID=509963 RepID=UPI002905C371|nr:lipoma-preferred partner homolog [Ylistrum balloti]
MQQELEYNFGQMGLYDQSSVKKLPPAVAPKPRRNNDAPAPFKPGANTYRQFNPPDQRFNPPDDDFPPPPPPQMAYTDDTHGYLPPPPPPPPPDTGKGYDSQEDYFPPPPQVPQGQSGLYGRQSPVSVGYSAGTSPVNTGYNSATSTSPGYSGQTSPRYGGHSAPRYAPQSPDRSSGRTPSPAYNTSSYSPPNRGTEGQTEYTTVFQGGKQSPQPYSLRSSSPAGRTSPYGSSNYANLPGYSPMAPQQQPDQHIYARPNSTSSEGFTPSYHQLVEDDRPLPGPQVPAGKSPLLEPVSPTQPSSGKEAEVDALTNLLMANMESTKEPDYFGMCSRCGKKVMGENNACTTNDQVYHIACFACLSCGTMLRGKSFYSMDSKPYCETCYLNTLERCSVCSKPITDRLLRATGKPYHPGCFTCVVCGKSLDGIPFTVDATNQIHCIEDFHKKFAPRCCVCQLPIMPDVGLEETVRVVAMDRSFHVQCYRCEDCGLLLSSEAEGRGCYPLDEHILCKNCNAKRIQSMTTKMTTEL